MEKLHYIDLFAGCGGLSLGLYNSKKWKGLFAVEKSPMAFETLKYNLVEQNTHFEWVKWLPIRSYDINYIVTKYKSNLESLKGKVDLVAGGPPCQGFSSAGKRVENDGRNRLINSYIKFIELVQPKAIFFENVKGFTLEFKKNKTRGIAYSKKVLLKLEELGYNVKGQLVDFSEYGIPQKRVRFILVGFRKDVLTEDASKWFFQKISKDSTKFLINKGLVINPTLEDAISDLLRKHGTIESPDTKGFDAGIYGERESLYQNYLRGDSDGEPDSHRFVNHRTPTIEKFKLIQREAVPNRDIGPLLKNKLGVKKNTIIFLGKNHSGPTLTTLPDDYIHYEEPRILTVREYARIQSFNDWYEIKGKYTTGGKFRIKEVPRYSQIGNAIPPLFGEQVGRVMSKILNA